MDNKKIVLALGGNAIIKKGDTGDFYSQWDNTYESMKPVVDMIARELNLSKLIDE